MSEIMNNQKKSLFNELLKILDEIDYVCKNNNITYWIAYGTLIGAVRHKGFIPWDDDIDLFMKRDQYEKFIKVCETELHEGFSIQTTLNQEGYYRYVARVRDDNTTLLTSNDLKLINHGEKPEYNMGVFISVFPLDTVPTSKLSKAKQHILSIIRHRILVSCIYNTENTLKSKIARLYCSLVGYKNVFRRLDNGYSKFSKKEGQYLHIAEEIDGYNNTFCSSDFEDTILLEFEGKMYPAPSGYDRILRTYYGDYMVIPPEEKRETKHSEVLCLSQGYKDYLKDHYAQYQMS